MNESISIIVTCYNKAQYFDDCLQSVLNQTYTNWECIIVNDGSTDDTEKIALKWTLKDERFKYFSKENGGASSARNYGIKLSKSKWILPLDSDDILGKDYLQLASKEFNNGYTIIYCKANRFGAIEGYWDLPEFDTEILKKQNIIFCTAFYKKEDWEKVNGYDETLIYVFEDWDFWLSLMKLENFNVYRLNSIQFYYRVSHGSLLQSVNEKKLFYSLNILYNKHRDFFERVNGTYFEILYKYERLLKDY